MQMQWETVYNAFEMSTSVAIVLLGGFRWLKPVTTLTEIGSKAEGVDCPCLKPFLERRVPRASTMHMVAKSSRSRIFSAG